MKLDSPWFDRIRVAKDEPQAATPAEGPRCEHVGCRNEGLYRAPKGRGRENQYWRFCLEHVRAYNQSYNFFQGMSDDDLKAYERDAHVGHRPTWAMGRNGSSTPEERVRMKSTRGSKRPWAGEFDFDDAFDVFGEPGSGPRRERAAEPKRELKNVERKSFEALNLAASASGAEIKARYKELLIRFHPDTNGGDRGAEDKLREIIQAYNHLRSAGFC